MKRLLSIIMILIIISMTVLMPLPYQRVHATTTETLLSALPYPGFWIWWQTATESMGWNTVSQGIEGLQEKINFAALGSNVTDYFNNLYDMYEQDVQETWYAGSVAFKVVGDMWQKMFSGDPESAYFLQLLGVKGLAEEAVTPESPYYIDPYDATVTLNGISPFLYNQYITGAIRTLLQYSYNESQRYSIVTENGVQGFITSTREWYISGTGGNRQWYVKTIPPQSTWEMGNCSFPSNYAPFTFAFIPVLSWINSDGSYTNNAKFKLDLIPVESGWQNGVRFTDISSVYDINRNRVGYVTDAEIISTLNTTNSFDNEITDKTLTPEDLTAADWVQYDIDRASIEALQALMDKIDLGTDVPADWAIPAPQVVEIETTNVIIREIIRDSDIAIAIPDVDFPNLGEFEMPNLIINKFPFCIPFDVYRAFSMLSATAEVPVWTIPFDVEGYIDYDFVIDMHQFQGIIDVVRWFLLAAFILSLILLTRSLIKG